MSSREANSTSLEKGSLFFGEKFVLNVKLFTLGFFFFCVHLQR